MYLGWIKIYRLGKKNVLTEVHVDRQSVRPKNNMGAEKSSYHYYSKGLYS